MAVSEPSPRRLVDAQRQVLEESEQDDAPKVPGQGDNRRVPEQGNAPSLESLVVPEARDEEPVTFRLRSVAAPSERFQERTTPGLTNAEPIILQPPHLRRPEVAAPRSAPTDARQSRALRDRLAVAALLLADAVGLLGAVLLADSSNAVLVFGIAVVVWAVAGLYGRRFTMSLLDDTPAVMLGVICGAALAPAAAWGPTNPPAYAAACLLAGVLVARAAAYAVIRWERRNSPIGFPVVILGSGPTAVTLAERIAAHAGTGLRLVGVLDETPPSSSSPIQAPYLGTSADLSNVVDKHGVRDLIVCDGQLRPAELIEVVRACGRLSIQIHVVPTLLQMHRMLFTTDQVWGIPLERVRRHSVTGLAWRTKRLMDVTLASIALTLLSPVMALLALSVRYELGRGVLFRQERIGLDGKPFSLLKFRSMPHLTDDQAPWSVAGDSRLGPVGQIIRRYSLDELPQLFNVLKGDMSLVGPRPERPTYVVKFTGEVSGYGHRHRMPVGVTGLAAVEGLRGDTSVDDRAYFDNFYIENWSLWLDMKILIRTIVAVVRGTGG